MKTKNAARFAVLFLFSVLCALAGRSKADEKEITSGVCDGLTLSDIPVGNFNPPVNSPEDVIRITQGYNTSKEEGFYHKGTLMYGHDGLDIHEKGAWAGKNNVYSVQEGVVILSHKDGTRKGWGESVFVATRASESSEEILTMHYHHLHSTLKKGVYKTTRLVNACDHVAKREALAKEGGTGGWPVHLHYSIRRWKNLEELKSAMANDGEKLYGPGYAYGNSSRLANHLDPEGYLFQTYKDYATEGPIKQANAWSFPYAQKMRRYGIEFGQFDGRFGALEPVLRREAARWIKIAAKRKSIKSGAATFSDVGKSDKDFPYVEALTRYPEKMPVINPDNSCQPGKYAFCPDNTISRAEALKMVVLAFYEREYLQIYKNQIWEGAFNTAIGLLSQFLDVEPVNWYASYVYFGTEWKLVSKNKYFHPTAPITREELAKWIIMGYEYNTKVQDGACMYMLCPLEYFCEPITGKCYQIPYCVPSETQTCAVGGGYGGSSQPVTPKQPADPPEENPPEGNPGQPPADPPDSPKQPPDSQPDPEPEDPPGEPPQNPPPSDPRDTCKDTYLASTMQACYGNPQGSGNPQLCLIMKQVSGPDWKYRICKQGDAFINDVNFQLRDENHLLTLDTNFMSVGSACTPWVPIHMGFIPGYGAVNGAGLRGHITSPAWCTQSSCQYKTGGITISKICK